MPSPPLPTGVVTFLFTDIEGSTRIAQEVGAARYGELLERHRAVLRDAFSAAGGIEVGTEGDSFFVVFERPGAAVDAAADAQRRLAAVDWPPDGVIRVRMGIHSGDGQLADGTYVGNDVNRAARIAAAGHGGQVLLSEVTSTLVADGLPGGVGLRDLGRHRLKDLRPERICQLIVDGLRVEFPAIRSLDARPNNLPTQLTTFVGRERELGEAAALLESTRLLTLTGPGGTGKTRLSLQLAARVADGFPDGVFFVALEPVRDPALVAPRIAAAVGLAETGARPAHELLLDWLPQRRVLFVLDNFEQVLAGAEVVAELLRASETVTVLVTSRAPLHVSGEQEYPVEGLPAPPDPSELGGFDRSRLAPDARTLDTAAVEQYESVRLFVARARAVRPGFTVTPENAGAVAAICARLYGMPLAIELAAARIKVFAAEAILERLDQQLQLLAGGARDLPERQQTLRGAIAWSYDMLDDGLRRLLDRLSVFVGGFDLATAEAVCGPGATAGLDVVDGVATLVDQSLVRPDAGDAPRFRLLETIREFAAEHLEERGEAAEIRERHLVAFLDLAEEAARHLAGDDQRTWLDRLSVEHDNLRAALDRAVAAEDGRRAIRLAFALWRFWQKRGHLPEARRRLEAIAARSCARDDPALWAKLNEALGGVAWWQADLPAMTMHYEEALGVWRELGDKRELANALYNASFSAIIATDPEEMANLDADGSGLRRMTEAHDLFEELGDDAGVGNTLWVLGNREYFRAGGDHGVALFRESLERFRRAGDRTMEAWALHQLGSALLRLNQPDEARLPLRDALNHFRAAGDAAGIALVLDDLSSLAAADHDLVRSARLHGAARSLTRETGAALASLVDEVYEGAFRPNAKLAMSREELERWGAEGARMSLDEAVAYALEQPAADGQGATGAVTAPVAAVAEPVAEAAPDR